jgi:hypothetical protein
MGDIKTSNEMTPKEKAEKLIGKFKPLCVNVKHTGILDGLATVMNDDFINLIASKQCALIAVDEIIKTLVELSNGEYIFIHNVQYWEQVKNEINKL